MAEREPDFSFSGISGTLSPSSILGGRASCRFNNLSTLISSVQATDKRDGSLSARVAKKDKGEYFFGFPFVNSMVNLEPAFAESWLTAWSVAA